MRPHHLILGALGLERAGFYSFLALYTLYRQAIGDTVEQASMAVGVAVAAVYGSTFLGGWTGRRWGFKAAGGAGLIGLVIAYALLAAGVPDLLAMVALALSIGMFKPTPVVMIGKLTSGMSLEEQDAAMTRLYVAVNIGGCCGPLLAGAVVGNWGLAFAMSSAMCAASAVLWSMARDEPPIDEIVARTTIGSVRIVAEADVRVRSRSFRVILGMCAVALIFYAGYNAFFGSVTHWIKDGVNRTAWGVEVPVPWFNAENGAIIVALGLIWPKLMSGWKISSRFLVAMVLSAISFGVLIYWSGRHVAPAWVAVMVVAIQTVAEIALSPLGLSRVQSLAPSGSAGMMTACWYLSTSMGGALSGVMSFSALTALLVVGAVMTVMMRYLGILDYDPRTETDMSMDGARTLARSPGKT